MSYDPLVAQMEDFEVWELADRVQHAGILGYNSLTLSDMDRISLA